MSIFYVEYAVYATALFSADVMSWCSRNDTQIFTSVILHINIILHSDCLVVILKFYTVPMFLHAIRNFVN